MKKNAFTLIELLVVISIIGILAALLLANFAGIRDRADDAQRKGDAKQMQTALRMLYNDVGSYPTAAVASSINCSAIPGLNTYLQGGIPTGTCRYTGGDDLFTVCVNLSNPNDRERESVTNKCATEPTGTTEPYFCVCAN